MTLQEARAKEKRLENEIEVIKARINKWNCVKILRGAECPDGITPAGRPFDIPAQMDTLGKKIDALIKLKVDIQHGYAEKLEVIIRRQETEKYLVFLEGINMAESFYGQCNKSVDELMQLALIENTTDELESLNDDILKFEFQKVL